MATDFNVYGPLQDYMLDDSCRFYIILHKKAAEFTLMDSCRVGRKTLRN